MRVALDTNLLAYAAGINGQDRLEAAAKVLDGLDNDEVFVPVQALGELYGVLLRKARWSGEDARREVARWQARTMPIPTTVAVMDAAIGLAAAHRLAIWDSVMLAAAAEAACDLLLTEDMQDGFTWRGVTLRNPFAVGA